jgi:hypothetical protein
LHGNNGSLLALRVMIHTIVNIPNSMLSYSAFLTNCHGNSLKKYAPEKASISLKNIIEQARVVMYARKTIIFVMALFFIFSS